MRFYTHLCLLVCLLESASAFSPIAHPPCGARTASSVALCRAHVVEASLTGQSGKRLQVEQTKTLVLLPQDSGPTAQTGTVLFLCCLIAALCSLDRVLISIAIIPMSEQFGYSDSTKGAIAAGFSIGYCLGLLPTGAAASLGSPKKVLLGGLVLWSVAQAASPSAALVSLPLLLVSRALMGVGEAAAVPSLQAVAARFVPAETRSLFWGCLTASLSCGTVAAYKVSPSLIEANGWPFAFLAYGGAGLLVALIWAAFGADAPTALDADTPKGNQLTGPSINEEAVDWRADVPWRDIASSRPVWALAAAHCSSNFFVYFGLSWLPTYFAYQFGLSTAESSAASLLPFAAGAVGSLTAGAAADSLVARGGVSLTNARKAMQSISLGGPMLAMGGLCALSAGVGGLELDRDEAEALFVFALGCQAFAAGGYGCGSQDISTRFSSLIYGATSVLAVITGACGQYFTGWLLEQNGRDFTPMFALVVIVELAGLIAWNTWWDSERAFE